MSDHEQTVHQVREMELKSGHDEMRTVRAQDGRTTVTEIQVRDEFAGWGTLAVGYARRKKGDRRDADLGGALSLYRALESLLERHREVFAQRWPGFFAKESRQVREARAAVKYAHEQVDVAAGEIENAQRAQYQKRQLEQRIQTALELLEASPEAWLGGSNNVTAAAHVLRGGEAKEMNPSNDRGARALKILQEGPRIVGEGVVEAWSSVACRALAVLRGEADDA
ncbi:hypothetical protein [Streptomyces mirabilis]|uniref:hypothetical protein n=1 Tax=Streptomyces mirabilis TaxID=68239 RepID=UPI0036DC6247